MHTITLKTDDQLYKQIIIQANALNEVNHPTVIMLENKKILFAHLGYMKYYGLYPNKIDPIQNGGSYITEHHFGHEELNFQNLNGYFYGFVEQKSINLKKINPSINTQLNYLDNVLVIFFATRPKPQKGAVIIGWYNRVVF
jgi:hypothetical protein